MARGLTEKQRKFCREYIANGGDGTKAYLKAYDSESEKAAQVESFKLLRREDIRVYLDRLRRPVERALVTRVVSDRNRKKEIIEQRLEACIEQGDDVAIARYIEILNKMDGEYVNINKDITDRPANIGALETTTLLRLVGDGD